MVDFAPAGQNFVTTESFVFKDIQSWHAARLMICILTRVKRVG